MEDYYVYDLFLYTDTSVEDIKKALRDAGIEVKMLVKHLPDD